jgi:ubiquinone/menaquinone biosynthesis C-methylase UbiE
VRVSTKDHWRAHWAGERTEFEAYTNGERLIEALATTTRLAGARVLEVGAGTGRDAVRMAAMGAHVTVIDYVREALDIVQRNARVAGAHVETVHGDAFAMPFDDGSFDVVFHQGLLEHFRDPARLLTENHRVLRAGGVLLVDVPQRWHPYTVVKKVYIAAGKWFAGWETEYSIRELQEVVERTGLRVEHRYGDWLVPNMGYRAARRYLAEAGVVTLPSHPRVPVLTWLAERLRRLARRSPLALWTYATIGVVARKP